MFIGLRPLELHMLRGMYAALSTAKELDNTIDAVTYVSPAFILCLRSHVFTLARYPVQHAFSPPFFIYSSLQ